MKAVSGLKPAGFHGSFWFYENTGGQRCVKNVVVD